MPKLIVNPGTPEAYEYELKPGSNSVGRTSGNDLTIPDPSVSSSHAEVILNGDSVTVRDVGSTNGTFVNRSQIVEAVLQPGQTVRFGGVDLAFEAGSVVTSATPSSTTAAATPPPGYFKGEEVDTVVIRARPEPEPVAAPAGVRVARPPVTENVPVPPPILAAAVAAKKGGKSNCRFHPKSPGTWMCPKCNALYCDLCVGTRPVPGSSGMGHFCRPCGVLCSQVEVHYESKPLDEGGFYTHLPKAFAYPFERGGGFLLGCATVFFVVLSLLRSLPALGGAPVIGGRIILTVMYYGYLYSYLQNVIHSTAQGDEHAPTLPDITDISSDLAAPAMQLFSTIILSFGLAIGFMFWAGYQAASGDQATAIWGVVPAMLLGCAYFPMAFLTVAIFDNIGAINPMVVVPAIFVMPVQYLLSCLIFLVGFGVNLLGAFVLPPIVIATGVNQFLAPLIISPITGFIWLYLLTVMARILGLLYYTNKEELGWFNR